MLPVFGEIKLRVFH